MLSAESSPIHPLFPLLSLSLHVCASRTERKRKVFLSPPSPPPVRRGSSFQFASKPSLRRTTLLKAPLLPSLSHFSRSIPPYPTSPPKAFAVHSRGGGGKKGVCVTAVRAVVVREGGSRKTIFFIWRECVCTRPAAAKGDTTDQCAISRYRRRAGHPPPA